MLRQGFTAFLREVMSVGRDRRIPVRVVPCGGRNAAYDCFRTALDGDSDDLCVLVVDSEGEVESGPIDHLVGKEPTWDMRGVNESLCHLMVQAMESWLVCDVEALRDYYGQGFLENSIVSAANIEQVPIRVLMRRLANATRNTATKGAYHKIKHGASLLGKIDPVKVRKRAPHCRRLFIALASAIGSAELRKRFAKD